VSSESLKESLSTVSESLDNKNGLEKEGGSSIGRTVSETDLLIRRDKGGGAAVEGSTRDIGMAGDAPCVLAREVIDMGEGVELSEDIHTIGHAGTEVASSMSQADAFHARGFAHRKRGDFEAAIHEYTRAIELDPKHFKAYFNRGFSYDKMGECDAAIADYTEVGSDPNLEPHLLIRILSPALPEMSLYIRL